MANLSDFVPYALPRLPGAIDQVIEAETLDVAIEFCRESKAWNGDLSLVAGATSGDFIIDVPQYAVVDEILSVSVGGEPLTPCKDVANISGNNATHYSSDGGVVVYIGPGDLGSSDVSLKAVLVPSDDTDELPNLLFQKFRNAIKYGVFARMMMLPNQPFSNAQLASYYEQKFKEEIDKARMNVAKGFVNAPVRVPYQPL